MCWLGLWTQTGSELGEVSVLVIMRRTWGVLLAIPESFLPNDVIEMGNAGVLDSVFGPSVELTVPAMQMMEAWWPPLAQKLRSES